METDERSPIELYDWNMLIHDTVAEAADFCLGTNAIGVIAANHNTQSVLTFVFNQSASKRENYRAAIDWALPREHYSYSIVGGDIDG